MDRLDLPTLLHRLDHQLDGLAHPLLATDADGTLWSGDVGTDAFEALLAERRVRPEAHEHLREQARMHDVEPGATSTETASALYRACEHGVFPEALCYEMMAWSFAGFTVDEAQEFAREVQRRTGLDRRFHAETIAILQWARRRSVGILVVSASPWIVVQCGVEPLGISPDQVVGARAAVLDGVVQPLLAEPMPYGEAKVTAIRRAAPQGDLLAALGDNAFDMHMLKCSAIPIAIRPKYRLRDIAAQLPTLVELEPAL